MRPLVERLAALPGDKYCELKLGLTEDRRACGFFDADVRYRGIVDLLVADGNRGWMIDYKTGKSARYADMKQLDLMAGALFVRFPKLQTIKSGLLYVVSNEFIKKTHVREELDSYLSVFNGELERLDGALESGVFNPKSGPLCGWCPVKDCAHWRARKR
jgi:hypothetical protein